MPDASELIRAIKAALDAGKTNKSRSSASDRYKYRPSGKYLWSKN